MRIDWDFVGEWRIDGGGLDAEIKELLSPTHSHILTHSKSNLGAKLGFNNLGPVPLRSV